MFRGLILLYFLPLLASATILKVGANQNYKTILKAIDAANAHDTVLIEPGIYVIQEYTLNKPLTFLGKKQPTITGNGHKIFLVESDSTHFIGLKFTGVATSYVNDDAAIRFDRVEGGSVQHCRFDTCFFAIFIGHSASVSIINNTIQSHYSDEASSGNAVHGWYSQNLTITNNEVYGHRDGIYLEFVENSTVTNNHSHDNLRYGLHFMFSHNNTYSKNIFERNGAGCAVMYSNNVTMLNNIFRENWGEASYGMLLKDIKDSKLKDNYFYHNSIGIHADNSMRLEIRNNIFEQNGWGLRIMGSCMENVLTQNDFIDNSFQIATNSQRNYNDFTGNYWSDYTGYDLDRNNRGDVPHRPVNLYTFMVTQNAPTIILMRSFVIDLINLAEKVMPTITPETLIDESPLMKPVNVKH